MDIQASGHLVFAMIIPDFIQTNGAGNLPTIFAAMNLSGFRTGGEKDFLSFVPAGLLFSTADLEVDQPLLTQRGTPEWAQVGGTVGPGAYLWLSGERFIFLGSEDERNISHLIVLKAALKNFSTVSPLSLILPGFTIVAGRGGRGIRVDITEKGGDFTLR